MTAWPRRQDTPANPLTEDRKRLVHSYMDAEEEQARREAIEERERQSRIREQAPRAASPERVQQQPEGAAPLRVVDEAVERELADEAARQVAAAEEQARREMEQE